MPRDFALDDLGRNPEFLRLLQSAPIETMHTLEATLDDIFIKVTGRSLSARRGGLIMTRLVSTLGWEVRIQWRQGLYYAAIFVVVLWSVVLLALPPEGRALLPFGIF